MIGERAAKGFRGRPSIGDRHEPSLSECEVVVGRTVEGRSLVTAFVSVLTPYRLPFAHALVIESPAVRPTTTADRERPSSISS